MLVSLPIFDEATEPFGEARGGRFACEQEIQNLDQVAPGWLWSRFAPAHIPVINSTAINQLAGVANGCLWRQGCSGKLRVSCAGIEFDRKGNRELAHPSIQTRLIDRGLGKVRHKRDSLRLVSRVDSIELRDIAVRDRTLDSEKQLNARGIDRVQRQW